MDHKLKCKVLNYTAFRKKNIKYLRFWIRQRLLRLDTKTTIHTRKKIGKLDVIKMKNYCSAKDPVKKMKS